MGAGCCKPALAVCRCQSHPPDHTSGEVLGVNEEGHKEGCLLPGPKNDSLLTMVVCTCVDSCAFASGATTFAFAFNICARFDAARATKESGEGTGVL
eukprot:scaffold29059_cov21-Tisochrysis_lutea.AAC.1